MAVKISHQNTTRFLDRWAYVPSSVACFLFLLLLFSSSLAKTVIDKQVTVSEGEAARVDTVKLTPKELGALRIDVKSFFPNNHWVVSEIQLVDQNGQVIVSAMDEAWRESGTWREGGESGTWSESDLLGGLDIQSQQAEQLDVVIEVLDSGKVSGAPADLAVSFDVKVKKGVIQTSHLWWGLIYTSILGILALWATRASGNKVISKTLKDSDPKGRAVLGGEDNLVRVKIHTELDENTNRNVKVNLSINNVYGEQVYKHSRTIPVALKKNDSGEVTGGTAKLEYFLILKERGSYSFQARIEPDAPVDSTSLIVRDGTKTLQSVSTVQISPVELSGKQRHFTME
ncbi:conserved hypothetical protein [Hyella patelloides LEGE 07179]|uniref:Uncharacterized protein n=1 Tax=Hyella patelloides LEGE 07179 TaxID=945734 RepID=A0A563VZX0_9CYAN|nr:hypothetical protein [Hyella patelloides]VEP17008.1 conserved hypothetical protein [Hyella patelloides LEGE 07179]